MMGHGTNSLNRLTLNRAVLVRENAYNQSIAEMTEYASHKYCRPKKKIRLIKRGIEIFAPVASVVHGLQEYSRHNGNDGSSIIDDCDT